MRKMRKLAITAYALSIILILSGIVIAGMPGESSLQFIFAPAAAIMFFGGIGLWTRSDPTFARNKRD